MNSVTAARGGGEGGEVKGRGGTAYLLTASRSVLCLSSGARESSMSETRDWSLFIGERLSAPWTADRAGPALIPEHLRQVASKWFTIASQVKLRLLLAVVAARRQDAPAPNRAAFDGAFQELLSKISEEDDEWVVLIGTLLKDVVSDGRLEADLSHPKLRDISAALASILERPDALASLMSLWSLDSRYLRSPTQELGAEREEQEEKARLVHCARPNKDEYRRRLENRGLRDLECSVVSKPEASHARIEASSGAGSGGAKALVFEKKATTPRASQRNEGMWWVGSQTAMDAADKLQSQRSQRRVLVEDNDESSGDEAAGVGTDAGSKRKLASGKDKSKADGRGLKRMRSDGVGNEVDEGGAGMEHEPSDVVLPEDTGEMASEGKNDSDSIEYSDTREGGRAGQGPDGVEGGRERARGDVGGDGRGEGGAGPAKKTAKETIDEWKKMLKSVQGDLQRGEMAGAGGSWRVLLA
jgi:hypothetical protein